MRSRYYASRVGKYFIVGISLRSRKLNPDRIGNILILPTNGWNRLHALYRMYRLADQICREERIDIVQTADPAVTGFVGYLMKKKYHKLLQVCVLGHDPYDDNWLREKIMNRLLAPISKHILGVCDGVMVDARKIINNLIQKGKVPPSKIFYLPFIPHDIRQFRMADGSHVRNRLLRMGETRLVLFVGRLNKQKNVGFLLSCFWKIVREFTDVGLVIIGQGPEGNNLKRMGRKLGIANRIRWIDFVPRSTLAEYYRAADVFVLCSLFEGFPRVLMEATMAGIPIVATNVGGVEDIIQEGKNGFIVRPGDEGEFVEKVLFLLRNSGIARKMGGSGQATVAKQLDPQKMIMRGIGIWDKIVAKHRDDDRGCIPDPPRVEVRAKPGA